MPWSAGGFGYDTKRSYVKDVVFKATDLVLPLLTVLILGSLIYMEQTRWIAQLGL